MNIIAKFASGLKTSAKSLFENTSSKIGMGLFAVGLITYCGFSKSSEVVNILTNLGALSGGMVAATLIAGALIDQNDITKVSSLKWLFISGLSIVTSLLLSLISLPIIQYLAFTLLLTGSILASLLFIYTSFVSPMAWAIEMTKELDNTDNNNIEKDDKEEIEQEKELGLTYYFKK